MIFIGIDPSLSGTALVGVDSHNELLFNTTLRTELTGVERLVDLKSKLLKVIVRPDLVMLDSNTLITVEGYAFSAKGKGVSLAEWGGVLRLTLHELGFNFTEVPPTSVKKFITNNGNANKVEMAVAVQKKYGVEFGGNDNEFDAYALAQVGRGMNNLVILTQYQKDVLVKIGVREA